MRLGHRKPKEQKTWFWILGFWCAFSRAPLVLSKRVFWKCSMLCCWCIWELFSTLTTKGKIKRKTVQDEILTEENREAGRWDEEGSPPHSPTPKTYGTCKDKSKLLFLTHYIEKYPSYPILKAFFYSFFHPRGQCSNKLPRKETGESLKKFSWDDNTLQKWKLLHLLYMVTVKSPFYCSWSWIGRDWYFHTGI